MSEETQYRLLSLLEQHPEMSQRDLARHMGVSLGKVNYCLQAIVEKGWVKAGNFKRSDNKMAYLYILTPLGIEQKARIAVHFLQRKMREYETLKAEIENLQREVSRNGGSASLARGGDE